MLSGQSIYRLYADAVPMTSKDRVMMRNTSLFMSTSSNQKGIMVSAGSLVKPKSIRKLHMISIKFFKSLNPTAPLFSGWNCTPYVFLLKMDDANGHIYVVVVSV